VDFYSELRQLVAELENRAIDYALCGAVALAIHGVTRATQDIDILLRPQDLDRLREAIRPRGFTFEALPMDFTNGVSIQRFTKLVEGQPFSLDVVLVRDFLEKVWNDRLSVSFEGGKVKVVSEAGLITLKLVAARPQDLVDVKRLGEVNRG